MGSYEEHQGFWMRKADGHLVPSFVFSIHNPQHIAWQVVKRVNPHGGGGCPLPILQVLGVFSSG